MPVWDDKLPIYQQLADRLGTALLDGDPPEGAAMPSVRVLSSRYQLNPLTVHRALQALGDGGLLETRRGLGLYVLPGAQAQLRQAQRQQFLDTEWPQLRSRLRQLGLSAADLRWE